MIDTVDIVVDVVAVGDVGDVEYAEVTREVEAVGTGDVFAVELSIKLKVSAIFSLFLSTLS